MRDDRDLHVRVRFANGKFRLDVEFEVPPGVTILFGHSGAGKSTVLAAVAGLIRPDDGRIALGTDVWFDSQTGIETPVHKRRIALVFQDLALFPHLSALGNVEYGVPRPSIRKDRERLAAEMLERMKVGHLAGRRPHTFSGGEAQRVALARAFAMSPRVVLLDEPFSAMDWDLRRALMADVRSYVAEAQIPAIQVTHQRSEARSMGDRVILIEQGSLKEVGKTDDVLHRNSRRYQLHS